MPVPSCWKDPFPSINPVTVNSSDRLMAKTPLVTTSALTEPAAKPSPTANDAPEKIIIPEE